LQIIQVRVIYPVLQETDAQKVARLERENTALKTEIQQLRADLERLQRLLEEALRASKRQTAPFSRQKPKANLITQDAS
jgi:molecular chaperone GrpE (heat shock protein)